MNKVYTTSAVATGGRDGHVKSADGAIDIELRTPGAPGAPGASKGATTPEDLFASGYAACFAGALNLAVRLNHLKLSGEPTVKVTVSLGRNDDGSFQLAADIEAQIPGVEEKRAQELAEQAHTICPYSRATHGNIEATVRGRSSR